MYVEQLYTGCIAVGTYYIESNGEAIIIDPLRDPEPYMVMAAERNFENPNQITSASTIVREIVCEYLDNDPAEATSSLKGGCVK